MASDVEDFVTRSMREESNPTRRAIVEAMERLLSGRTQVVEPGRLSVSALALEARVPRNHLNRQYDDLRTRFLQLSEGMSNGAEPPAISRAKHDKLVATTAAQEAVIKELRHNNRAWKQATEQLARRNQVLVLDLLEANRQLRNLKVRVQHMQIESAPASDHPTSAATNVVRLRDS